MFNLVVTIIAVALVVIITATAVFYGGGAMSDGVVDAEAAKYRNEAAQIAGAVRLYRAQGNEIVSGFKLETLVEKNYLGSLPEGWNPGSDIIMKAIPDTADGAAEEICYTANKQSNFEFDSTEDSVVAYSQDTTKGIPLCDKPNLETLVPCCIIPDPV